MPAATDIRCRAAWLLTGAANLSRNRTESGHATDAAMTMSANDAVNPLFSLSGPTEAGFTCPMDSLLLIFLLLGGTADRPSINAPSGQAQAMARVRILRGEAIDFAASVNRRGAQAPENSQTIFQIAPIRSTAAIKNTDGRTVELQEFH